MGCRPRVLMDRVSLEGETQVEEICYHRAVRSNMQLANQRCVCTNSRQRLCNDTSTCVLKPAEDAQHECIDWARIDKTIAIKIKHKGEKDGILVRYYQFGRYQKVHSTYADFRRYEQSQHH